MTQTIKVSTDQLQLMSLFQRIVHVQARDCIEDEKLDRLIFVVDGGKMGMAIGRGGANIKELHRRLDKNVELVEYSDDPATFLKKMLNPKLVLDVNIETRPDGSLQAIVTAEPQKKGLVVGRDGKNAEKARLLAKRYFGITSVMINSPARSEEML